jgi:THO complex subunit 4
MAEILDMSLDDIIKNNKKSNPSSGGDGRRRGGSGSGGGGGAGGPTKRPFKRSGNRQGPYQPPKAPDVAWKHDMYPAVAAGGGAGGGRLSAIETGTKLYISNLDFGVSNDDIKELFSELGDLKRSSIKYDRSGRSMGAAEVVFARRADAVAAVKKYNNVQLDGKPMKIEIVGTNTPTAASAALPVTNGGLARNAARSAPRGGPAGLPQRRPHQRGGGHRGGGSGGRRGKERSQPKSAEELDAELEKYHAESMQTN